MYKIVAADSSEPKCSDSNSYEIEASDSLETKRSDSNSEKSDALPAIDTIILASLRVFHEQEYSLLSQNIDLALSDNPELNHLITQRILLPRSYYCTPIAILMYRTTVESLRARREREQSPSSPNTNLDDVTHHFLNHVIHATNIPPTALPMRTIRDINV